jgi:putative phosphoesterase
VTTLAVIGDTHIPTRARDLPDTAWRLLTEADLVLHTGDVTSRDFLDRLGTRTRLHVVRGNNDIALDDLPETVELVVEAVPIAMVHDSGARTGRRGRMHQRFPRARVVLFGHSHIPLLEDDGALLLLNPGSPTDRRTMPTFTLALLHVDGAGVRAEIVDLGLERAG